MYKAILFLAIMNLFFINTYIIAQSNEEWIATNIQTGSRPDCFYFTPKFDYRYNRFLRVTMGSNSDVVIKLMNKNTQECIRTVYISRNNSYDITNIPEGIYYLKLAFGTDWRTLNSGSMCISKFMNNNLYQIGEDLLDFYLVRTSDGYQVPSYELSLDVYAKNRNNEFETENISEDEFNR
jgi:hypothetical protein